MPSDPGERHPKTKRYPSVCDHMSVENSPVSRNRWTLSSFMLDFVSPKRRLRILTFQVLTRVEFLWLSWEMFRDQKNPKPQKRQTANPTCAEKNRKWPKNLQKTPETVLNGQLFSTLRLMVVSGQIHQPTKVNRRSYEVGVVMFGSW